MSLPVEIGVFGDSSVDQSSGNFDASQPEALFDSRTRVAHAAGEAIVKSSDEQLVLPVGNGHPTLFEPTEYLKV